MNLSDSILKVKARLGSLLCDDLSEADFVDKLSRLAGESETILRSFQSNNKQRIEVGRDQSVIDWVHSKGITLPQNQVWWWCNPDNRTGRIVGFDGNPLHPDQSFGIPRITNGIDVYIERMDGTLFLGHKDWLKLDRKQSGNGVSKACACGGKDKECPDCGGSGVKEKSSIQKLKQTFKADKVIDSSHLCFAKRVLADKSGASLERFKGAYADMVGKTMDATDGVGIARAFGEYLNKKWETEFTL